VRLTRAGKVYTAPLVIGLDRRATYTLADRKAQFDAANRVKDLFGRMTKLVGEIAAIRGQAAGIGAKLEAGDPLRAQLVAISEKADTLRKLVVATKEGGAITGEERLREKADDVYGSIASTEGAPTAYAVARIDALDHELSDVEKSFATLTSTDLPSLNEKLKAKSLPPIAIADAAPALDDASVARGGPVQALFGGLVGARFTGSTAALTGTTADER
jgi:hypothetical protein